MTPLCFDIDQGIDQSGFQLVNLRSRGMGPEGHWHHGVEVLFIQSGAVEVTFAGQSLVMPAGSAIVHTGRTAHTSRPIHDHFVCTALHFTPDLSLPGASAHFVAQVWEEEDSAWTFALDPKGATRAFWAMRQLRDLRPRDASRPLVEGLVGLIMAEIQTSSMEYRLPTAPDWDEQGLVGTSLLTPILAYMHSKLDSLESIQDVALRFNLSEATLFRLFSKHLGCPPKKHWLRLRLERACELLQSEASIKQIARECGFESLRGFERAFRREMKITPSEYRATWAR